MTNGEPVEQGRRLLENCFLFRTLTPEEKGKLLLRAHARRYAVGETIFRKGAPGNSMLALLSGEVRISAPSPDGKEVVLATIRPGEVFGEVALLDGKERTADATAVTACEITYLDRRDVLPILQQQPQLCLKLLEVLCEKLRRTTEQVEDMLFLDLPTRLAQLLLRVSESGTSAQSRVRLSQRELGAMIGGTRESVNKWLSTWQRQRILRVDKGGIFLLDKSALAELAGMNEKSNAEL